MSWRNREDCHEVSEFSDGTSRDFQDTLSHSLILLEKVNSQRVLVACLISQSYLVADLELESVSFDIEGPVVLLHERVLEATGSSLARERSLSLFLPPSWSSCSFPWGSPFLHPKKPFNPCISKWLILSFPLFFPSLSSSSIVY